MFIEAIIFGAAIIAGDLADGCGLESFPSSVLLEN